MKVAAALAMENLVEGLSVGPVKVTRIFARKVGEGERGPWSFEDVGVEEDGKLYSIKLKNCKPAAEYGLQPGVMASFKSQQGSKGTHGVKLVDDEFNGQVSRKLVCTPKVLIEIGGAKAAPKQAAPPHEEEPEPQSPGDFSDDHEELSGATDTGAPDPLGNLTRGLAACIHPAELVTRERYIASKEFDADKEQSTWDIQGPINDRILRIATSLSIGLQRR